MGVRLPRNTAVQDAQPTFPVDPATGLPAAAGGAPGTSNTTEETQLGVLAAVEATAAAAASGDPARTAPSTGVIYEGVVPLTVKSAPISLTASGDLVLAVAGKRIRVLALALTMTVKTTIKFQANAATDLTGAFPCGVDGGFVLPLNEHGWFTTTDGHKLNAVLGAASNVGGVLTYIEVE